jgi:predicted acetyltransferase
MSVRFRPGHADDVAAAARIVNHSFVGRSVAEFEALLADGPWSGVESLWIGEDDGRPAAVCQLHPLRQWIGGAALPVAGVGTVAVSPAHRRRGLAARMLESGLRFARERGDVATALYPFRVSYYAQLGYALVGEARQYRLAPQALPDAPAERQRIRLVDGDDEERAMKAVYALGARRETGQLLRSEHSWQRVWGSDDRAAAVYYGDDGEPEAYAIVRTRADLPPTERFLEVEERMWLDAAGQRAIYAWLGSLGDQWRELVYRAHPDERFEERIAEPRLPQDSAPGWNLWFPSATLLRGPMFRLLDVVGAFERRSLVPGARPVALRLHVEDRVLPENHGPWRVWMGRHSVEVEARDSGTVDAELRTDIATLSRIYIGDLSASTAVALGAATIDREEVLPRLDSMLRLPRPWMFDRF